MSVPSNSTTYHVQLESGVKNLHHTIGSSEFSLVYSFGSFARISLVSNIICISPPFGIKLINQVRHSPVPDHEGMGFIKGKLSKVWQVKQRQRIAEPVRKMMTSSIHDSYLSFFYRSAYPPFDR